MSAAQDFYDRAHTHYRQRQMAEARSLIDQAVELAPEDLEVRLLAGHIHWSSPDSAEHFELILDRDVQYRDTLHPEQPHYFVELLTTTYALSLPRSTEKIDDAWLRTLTRYARYFDRLLQAGRPISHFQEYLEILLELQRFDDVIALGELVAGRKRGADLGLPGLDAIDLQDGLMLDDDPGEHVMTAYYYAGRHREALDWIRFMVAEYPDFAKYRVFLGEVHAWLGQPEQTAAEWIRAVRLDVDLDHRIDAFKRLVHLVRDPRYYARDTLQCYLRRAQKEIPAEKRETLHELQVMLQKEEDDPSKDSGITREYLESRLGIVIPPPPRGRVTCYERLHLPWTVSVDPLDKAAFARAARDDTRPDADEAGGDSVPKPGGGPQGVGSSARERERVPQGVTPAGPAGQIHTLERYGVDLTAQAANGLIPPIVGREMEISRLIRILARMEKNNAALLGEAGVGKTAVVLGLARRIAFGEVPTVLRGKRIIELNMGVLLAGTTYRGDFEKRITGIVREARDNPDVLLFIDELHTVMGAGAASRGDLDASNMIKPALARGELRLIGATTSREFSATIEKDPALERRFSSILLRELDAATSLKVLQARRALWEQHHGVGLSDEVLAEAIALSEAQLRHRKLPDKAIDLIDEACASLRVRALPAGDGPQRLVLEAGDLRQVLGEWKGATSAAGRPDGPASPDRSHRDGVPRDAPPGDVLPGEVPPDAHLDAEAIVGQLRESLVGQEEAVRRLSEVVIDLRLSLKEPSVPLVLLFHGPVGVGRTEAARALARVLWPGESDRILVLNMAELTDGAQLGRLIGVPIGYTGHEESGTLSLRLKRQPHSLIYLKDFNLAHARVQELFASIFKQGSFTDARGEVIAAQDAVFVLSVSLDRKQGAVGFTTGRGNTTDTGALPASLERDPRLKTIASTIPHRLAFTELSGAEIRQVVRLHLRGFARRLETQRVKVGFSEDMIEHLARRFLEQTSGERSLEALVNRELVPVIRRALLARGGALDGVVVIEAPAPVDT